MTTAVDAVFDTAELLETILSELELRYLFLSQRVSRTWRCAIATSPRLQQKLFLRPIGVDHASEITLEPDLTESICYIDVVDGPWEMLLKDLNPFLSKDRIVGDDSPESSDGKITPSWRNMLVSQRPPCRITFGSFGMSITSTEGIRLRQFLDELRTLEVEFDNEFGGALRRSWLIVKPFGANETLGADDEDAICEKHYSREFLEEA